MDRTYGELIADARAVLIVADCEGKAIVYNCASDFALRKI
jgi:hypothetical protein